MDDAPVRVLVADDQPPFRKAARAVLGVMTDFELVGEVASGEEAIAAAATLQPDLILMDVHMAGIGGIEATRRIVSERPEATVILVSSYRAEDLAAATVESGALAFLPKDQFDARKLSEVWSARAELRTPTGTRAQPSPGG
jgi:DNA-binding NarL/FixJ family response regulator